VYVTVMPVPVVSQQGVRLGAVLHGSLITMLNVGKTLLAGVVWVVPWAVVAAMVAGGVIFWRRRLRMAPDHS
ncbi:MAG: hypothetical protein ACP5QO_01830, partial [Clostridia bacterium]